VPLEINEIAIRMSVGADQEDRDAPPSAPQEPRAGLDPVELQAIIDHCVRAVLERLKAAEAR
jgi:hypothetical protein